MTKVIAFYLPQFHAIPENDKWWGKGFTEWTNVKKSKPLFKGHNQPEIPYCNNYYCLLDKKVQEHQAELAAKYGVDGFCYYHYWFEGKLLLEKPMENMLNNPNVKIPFCICWANETWSRTWNGKETDILIKQNYCKDEKAWKEHFEYLLQFFKDPRYIKENGKPLFIIYKPHLFSNCAEMLNYWNELAIKNGFPGIYFGYQHPSSYDHDLSNCLFDFGIEFEPSFTTYELKKQNSKKSKKILYAFTHPLWTYRRLQQNIFGKVDIQNYDEIWKQIVRRKENGFRMPGAFTGWDNSPRRGKNATIFYKSTPKKFKKYMSFQMEKAVKNHSRFLFINAWNEWAEGAHLEPDNKNKFEYLEALKEAVYNASNRFNG